MATVIHPSSLTLGTDVIIDTVNLTIQLVSGTAITAAGSTGGVTGQCLYSFLKNTWASSSTLPKYQFPMVAITPEEFEFVNGWLPKDTATRKLIRNAGWAERNASGTITAQYMGVISLGSLGSTDAPYYSFPGDPTPTTFTWQGPVNEAVQIYYAGGGTLDNTANVFTMFSRQQGKTYASATSTSIGASVLTYQVYRFPLSNATDLNISASDSTIASTAPWNQISVTFYGSDQQRYVDSATTSRPFRIIVNDASGVATTKQIYEKIQYLLRQPTDMDSGPGTVFGTSYGTQLVYFVGNTLYGATGVEIDGLNANYLNSVVLVDMSGVQRTYPFVAAGTLTFGSYAAPGEFKYWVYVANDFNSSSAVLLNDNSGNPIAGTYAGSPVTFTYAYDSNTQDGHTAGTDMPVKVVGIGTTTGQYISVDYTITRTSGQVILISPALERNFTS